MCSGVVVANRDSARMSSGPRAHEAHELRAAGFDRSEQGFQRSLSHNRAGYPGAVRAPDALDPGERPCGIDAFGENGLAVVGEDLENRAVEENPDRNPAVAKTDRPGVTAGILLVGRTRARPWFDPRISRAARSAGRPRPLHPGVLLRRRPASRQSPWGNSNSISADSGRAALFGQQRGFLPGPEARDLGDGVCTRRTPSGRRRKRTARAESIGRRATSPLALRSRRASC